MTEADSMSMSSKMIHQSHVEDTVVSLEEEILVVGRSVDLGIEDSLWEESSHSNRSAGKVVTGALRWSREKAEVRFCQSPKLDPRTPFCLNVEGLIQST